MIAGHATSQGTARYRDRFPGLRDGRFYRRSEAVPGVGELWLSSIGLGTYLGEPTESADSAYMEAVITALRSGINVLDTAINYRHQRSERNIGQALQKLIAGGELQRDEVLVCTKAGYLAFDGAMPADPRGYFMREYVQPGILDTAQVAGGIHCMAPRYLADQIERSRQNLGLETIDVFYVHNPESQLSDVSREVFRSRLKDAFSFLEEAVSAGRLRFYGIATWNGLRAAENEREYVGLNEVREAAIRAGGEAHHFRFVQLPFNLAMTEAFVKENHRWNGTTMSALKFAASAGVVVVGSATLYQGQLTQHLPDIVTQHMGMDSPAGNAIQFSRSAPGIATSLVGMGRKEHVASNLKSVAQPPASPEAWSELFTTR